MKGWHFKCPNCGWTGQGAEGSGTHGCNPVDYRRLPPTDGAVAIYERLLLELERPRKQSTGDKAL